MRMRRCAAAIGLALVLVSAVGTSQAAPPGSHAGGATLGDWIGRSWAKLLSLPADQIPPCVPLTAKVIAPLLAPAGQPVPTCTVKPGTRLFVGGSSAECSDVEPPPFFADNYPDAVACAMAFSAPLTRHTLTVDGRVIDLLGGGYSGASGYLTVQLPPNNILGVAPQPVHFAAWGYAVLLSPLPPGTHTLLLHQEGQTAPADYSATIVVVPPGH